MSGPLYLHATDGVEIFSRPYAPTFVSGGERVLIFNGKHGFVSPENFEWMKTASSDDLGKMRVMRITEHASEDWLPKVPKLRPESFRYQPEERT